MGLSGLGGGSGVRVGSEKSAQEKQLKVEEKALTAILKGKIFCLFSPIQFVICRIIYSVFQYIRVLIKISYGVLAICRDL